MNAPVITPADAATEHLEKQNALRNTWLSHDQRGAPSTRPMQHNDYVDLIEPDTLISVALRELSPALLHTFTHPQFPGSVALVATHMEQGREVQIAVARYAPAGRPGVAEFAVVVADAWQGSGLAGRLLRGLITAATVAGLDSLEGMVLAENQRMRRFAKALGFQSRRSTDAPGVLHVTRALRVVANPGQVENNSEMPAPLARSA